MPTWALAERCRLAMLLASPGDPEPGLAMSLGDVSGHVLTSLATLPRPLAMSLATSEGIAWRSVPLGGDVAWRCFGACCGITSDIAKTFGDVAGDVGHRLAFQMLEVRCRWRCLGVPLN